ncbi:hypothetical protein [Kiloniella antarctica]|uniref:Lipoprotein n=1 Tax=Kiloniella antarctica TaxID=1550907 RepID=A0ABW5BEG1_9PROT
MSKIIVSLSIIFVFALSGCQTTNNGWTDWEGIPKEEAILDWNQTKQTSLYARKVTHSGTYQEEWVWEDGSLFLTKAGHARHYRMKVDAKEFGNHLSDWNVFKESASGISAKMVQTTTNKYGKFYYAEVKNDKKEDCMAFMQSVRAATLAGYNHNSNPTGILIGYDCGEARYTKSEVQQFANSITYRK